jgi:hypothetical protein
MLIYGTICDAVKSSQEEGMPAAARRGEEGFRVSRQRRIIMGGRMILDAPAAEQALRGLPGVRFRSWISIE